MFAPTSLTEQGAVGARRSGRATALAVLALVLAAGLTGCEGTADSIGYDEKAGGHLRPLDMKPATYPNLFRELGRSDVEIANKIAAWFTQLFHGDQGTQAIFSRSEPTRRTSRTSSTTRRSAPRGWASG